jgi:glycosyltransferase involved in cell wall biosynthesis
LDVECVDSISHNQLVKELCAAECLAYPVDTTAWSEGFSCSILESCAARACPVVWDCDAIGDVYLGSAHVVARHDKHAFREGVIRALTDEKFRNATNGTARALAEKLTWRYHCERLMKEVEGRIPC